MNKNAILSNVIMVLSKKQPVTLTLSDLAFGGMAISKIKQGDSEFVIFVEGGVPGDTVEVEFTKIKKQYAVSKIRRRLQNSELLIPARCKHFGICGGCQWQFLAYEEQIKFKEKFVRDALERIGDIKNPPLLPICESPSPWFYRNKMEYSFSENAEGIPILGLHQRGKYYEVFDLNECYLQSQFSVSIAVWVKEWARNHKLMAYDSKHHVGFLKNLIIREARSTGEFMVNLVTSEEPFVLAQDFTRDILAAFPKITSLYHTSVRIQKGARTTLQETLLFGKPTLTEIIRVEGNFRDGENLISLIFDITPQAFFQPNTKGAERLLSYLLALAKPRTDDIVFDLYCGTGIIGMFLAKLTKRVYGIELNESAIESAKYNAQKNGLTNIEFLCGDVGKLMKKIPEKPTLVIVDPPRAGLTPQALDDLLALQPKKIIYVSCNPTTLARDLKKLTEMYTLKKVQPLDLFPQTYHVETLCLLTLND